MADEWAITLPSAVEVLPCLRSFLEVIGEVTGLSEPTLAAIVLSTHEAAVNVIRHAHASNPAIPLQIRCWVGPLEVKIELSDEGGPFDIGAVARLDPSEVRAGGRGVYLIRTLMDEVCCRPRTGGGNTLHLLKKRGERGA